MTRSKSVRIGVIADTHGLFDQAIVRHFRGVDHILHAGDIGRLSVIEQLRVIAPVTAVSGNVDGYEQSGFPSETVIQLAGRRIGIRHVLYQGGKLTKEGRAFLDREQPDICLFGHTHQPRVEWFGPTLLVNPGSAGPKRFTLPRGLGVLSLRDGRFVPRLISLQDGADSVSRTLGKTNFLWSGAAESVIREKKRKALFTQIETRRRVR
ncbi:MAG TPA: metallophosphoesterase family protein [Nitrospira sp.]|nr:metallophosphoesterase family protein [Nitrospira sp.]